MTLQHTVLALLLLTSISAATQQSHGDVNVIAPLQSARVCARSLHDDQGGACLQASSLPALGKLYPLSQDLYVEPGTGRVGLGTVTPFARLHVVDPLPAPAVTTGVRVDCDSPDGKAILGLARDPASLNTTGVHGQTVSSAGTGVRGDNGLSLTVQGSGVCGTTIGYRGTVSYPTAGVTGLGWSTGTHDHGVTGQTYSNLSGVGTVGFHVSQDGTGAGVAGVTFSDDANAVGVTGSVTSTAPGAFSAGVRGINSGTAGLGIGVWGSQAGTGYGVYGTVDDAGWGVVGSAPAGGWGVFAFGDMGAGGTKSFVQPHPSDASKEIRFVCLEGNESGTYFRGSSQLRGGRVVIPVPEDFRLVSESISITVQLTPRGPGALWVESSDLERIVVCGDGELAFDYMVNGVRRGFADFQTIRQNRTFVPHHRGEPFGRQYPDGLRNILVENGTLRPDFTPREGTARRLGWELRDRGPEPVLPRPLQPVRVPESVGSSAGTGAPQR